MPRKPPKRPRVTRTLLLCALAVPTGCKARQPASQVQDLAASPAAHNVALLMSGMNKDELDEEASNENLTVIEGALRAVASTYTFDMREFKDVTKEELLDRTATAATDVGTDGTLIWYITTHGWTDGFSLKGGSAAGRVRASDLIATLAAARARLGPMRRLVMFFDYCGSGGLVDNLRPPAAATVAAADTFNGLLSGLKEKLTSNAAAPALADGQPDGRFYQEAVFFAPAGPKQETGGDTLTAAIAGVIRGAKANPDMTIGDFLAATAKVIGAEITEDFTANDDVETMQRQRALYLALPTDDVLHDYMFHTASAP